MTEEIIVGIEGGTTSSKTVLINRHGKILSEIVGLHTNWILLGNFETGERLKSHITSVLKKAGLKGDEHINYLGLSLSGVDTESGEKAVEKLIRSVWSAGIDHVTVVNDTVGSLRTASDKGIVLISGTGSNCRLVHSNLRGNRVGGWGYHLGDEGSAYWIVHKGLKRMIDHEEGFKLSPHDTSAFKSAVLEYFKIESILELIEIFYRQFDKTFIAHFCTHVVQLAGKGDEFSKKLMRDAGFQLGRMVAAMARHCEKDELYGEEGLTVICVGGVWMSWELLKPGFLDGLKPLYLEGKDVEIQHICLKQLTVTAAKGAAYVACETAGHPLPLNYSENCKVFYKF